VGSLVVVEPADKVAGFSDTVAEPADAVAEPAEATVGETLRTKFTFSESEPVVL